MLATTPEGAATVLATTVFDGVLASMVEMSAISKQNVLASGLANQPASALAKGVLASMVEASAISKQNVLASGLANQAISDFLDGVVNNVTIAGETLIRSHPAISIPYPGRFGTHHGSRRQVNPRSNFANADAIATSSEFDEVLVSLDAVKEVANHLLQEMAKKRGESPKLPFDKTSEFKTNFTVALLMTAAFYSLSEIAKPGFSGVVSDILGATLGTAAMIMVLLTAFRDGD